MKDLCESDLIAGQFSRIPAGSCTDPEHLGLYFFNIRFLETLQEDCDASLNRLKEKFERETMAHLESKQKMADMETYLNDLAQQLHIVQQEKMKLEQVLNHSGGSVD